MTAHSTPSQSPTTELPPTAGEVAQAVERESAAYLVALEEEMARFFAEQGEIMEQVSVETLPMLDAIRDLSTGGKRLRALLAYWGYRGAGGAVLDPAVVKAGVAIELFQSAALIHDDIIDASDTRRGALSVHRRFERSHVDLGYKTSPEAYGLSSAILVGDLCLSWSEMVFSSIPGAGAGTEARFIFDVMRTEVMAGQYLDIVGEVVQAEEPQAALERALNVIRFKSAKYSCEHPLALGGALGLAVAHGEAAPLVDGYRAFALPLGEGFQLRDDVLGVFGEPETTGKPAGDDLREGKRTVLTAYTSMMSTAEERELLEAALGNKQLDADTIARIQAHMQKSGALDRVEALIAEKSREALGQLAVLEIAPDVRLALGGLAAKALRRSA